MNWGSPEFWVPGMNDLRPVKNLKDYGGNIHKVLLIGDTGTGKTTQFLTFPAPRFAYIFDPSAKASLAKQDVDTVEMLPERAELNLHARSITKDGKSFSDAPRGIKEPQLWETFVQDINARYDSGELLKYKSIMVDSLTIAAHALMDRVYFLQEKVKRSDERTDYGVAGEMLTDMIRMFTSLDRNFLFTVHKKMRKDEVSAKTHYQMTLPGEARTTIPRFFDNVLACTNEARQYMVQTVPDRENPTVRTDIRTKEKFLDVTIDWTKPLTGQGLGKYLWPNG